MKYLKRAGAIVATMLMAVSVVGCGGNTTTTETKDVASMTAEEKVNAAYDSLNDLKSGQATFDITLNMAMDNGVNPVEAKTETTMDIKNFSDPSKLEVITNMSVEGAGSQSVLTYAEETGSNEYKVYVYDGSDWYSDTADKEIFDQYGIQGNMAVFLDGAVDFKEVTQDDLADENDLGGKETIRIDAVLPADALKDTLIYSGSLESVSGLLGTTDEAKMRSMLEGIQDTTVSIWLDKHTNDPVKLSLDMTDAMNVVYTNVLASMANGQNITVDVSEMVMSMTIFNINSAEDFEIPAEARQ